MILLERIQSAAARHNPARDTLCVPSFARPPRGMSANNCGIVAAIPQPREKDEKINQENRKTGRRPK